MSRAASHCSIQMSENSSILIPRLAVILFEIRQLRSRQSQSDRACGSGFAIDESAGRERFDHLCTTGGVTRKYRWRSTSAGARP
jgi:hypothetical protein